jgi:hypothetical protein
MNCRNELWRQKAVEGIRDPRRAQPPTSHAHRNRLPPTIVIEHPACWQLQACPESRNPVAPFGRKIANSDRSDMIEESKQRGYFCLMLFVRRRLIVATFALLFATPATLPLIFFGHRRMDCGPTPLSLTSVKSATPS